MVSSNAKLCIMGVRMPFPKKDKHMKRITVTVDPDDYAEIDRLARSHDVSASWVIRRSMREFLDRHRGDAPDPMGGSEKRRVG